MASLIYLPTIYICIIILSGWHLEYKLYLLHAHLYTHVLQYTRWWDWCITRYPYHTLLHLYSQGHQGWAEGSQPRKAHIFNIFYIQPDIFMLLLSLHLVIYIPECHNSCFNISIATQGNSHYKQTNAKNEQTMQKKKQPNAKEETNNAKKKKKKQIKKNKN